MYRFTCFNCVVLIIISEILEEGWRELSVDVYSGEVDIRSVPVVGYSVYRMCDGEKDFGENREG